MTKVPFTLRIEKELLNEVRLEALHNEISVSQQIENLIKIENSFEKAIQNLIDEDVNKYEAFINDLRYEVIKITHDW